MTEMAAKFSRMYSEMTIENTIKLLLRCKLAFNSRKVLVDVFEALNRYETSTKELQ